ncbi:uncharacterized protein LOC130053800 isoform X2 [Ostrea edulis]|uniref:uncharacterized protein LOC130053800 isoform X2 n=1 Tax=Ostrea edulis TaxID=37623 RepID=UPI0024AFED5A|nr:uncharacterized protein LOC130053800 isoform X2 [Ostrea edulis]
MLQKTPITINSLTAVLRSKGQLTKSFKSHRMLKMRLRQEIIYQQRMCDTANDCYDNECCVSDVQPIGKRQIRHNNGHCVPMGRIGDGCMVKFGNTTSRPSHMVLACPCTPGLYCHGDHRYEVPLGEIGHCSTP